MRSRQINFYLAGADQARLEAAMRRVGDFLVLDSIVESAEPRILESTEIERMGEERLTVFLVRPVDLRAVKLNTLRDGMPKTIDDLRSPVVQFARCYWDEKELGRGRLYAVTAYCDREGLVHKDTGFTKWAAALMAVARRNLTKDPVSFFYFGQEALSLKASGSYLRPA
jgi:hypothetical protein